MDCGGSPSLDQPDRGRICPCDRTARGYCGHVGLGGSSVAERGGRRSVRDRHLASEPTIHQAEIAMSFAALVISSVALFFTCVNLAANIEILATLKSLRLATAVVDRVEPLSAAQLARIDLRGLPSTIRRQFADARGVLFLSTKCGTCAAIARDMNGRPPEGFVVVLYSSRDSAEKWLSSHGLVGQVLLDVDGAIVESIGLDMFPVVLRMDADEMNPTSGFAVPSLRSVTTESSESLASNAGMTS